MPCERSTSRSSSNWASAASGRPRLSSRSPRAAMAHTSHTPRPISRARLRASSACRRLCSAFPCLASSHAKRGQRSTQLGALTGLPGEVNRFVETSLRFGPSVGGCLIKRHVGQHKRQHTDGGLAARHGQCPVGKLPPDVRLPQPYRAHGCPGEQTGIVAELIGVFQHLDRGADGRCAPLAFAREDQRHSPRDQREEKDRKSTRLNSSHMSISYAVFCLKKKKTKKKTI